MLLEDEQMLNNGLAVETKAGGIYPQLAEVVPSVENGLWQVFPDGRMETSYRIREGDVDAYLSRDLV